MSTLALADANELVQSLPHIPGDEVVKALDNNNTELKILAQAPLRRDEPMPVAQAREYLRSRVDDPGLVESGHFTTVVRALDDDFVRVEGTSRNLMAIQTSAGRFRSASLGGHLATLAVTTETPLRPLIGESLKPRLLSSNVVANGSIESRLAILASLWETASGEWKSAHSILADCRANDYQERAVRTHIGQLIKAGIVERRKPNRESDGERSLRGYLYRLSQEGDPFPPVEVVGRYLSIVLLSSLLDPDFIEEGLDRLHWVSQNHKNVQDLLQRSADNTGHTGKKPRKNPNASSSRRLYLVS